MTHGRDDAVRVREANGHRAGNEPARAGRPYLSYIGSGPYCYASSLSMILDPHAVAPSVVEVLTGSPFGARLLSGGLLSFDPPGWDPGIGLDTAIDLLGWTCEHSSGGSAPQAIERLRDASAAGPVLVGPLELGLMLHRPGSGRPIESDHYVVVTGVEHDVVRFHDPDGYPHATLPVSDFVIAWNAETIAYNIEPYNMRAGFRAVRRVALPAAVRRSLPAAVRWLTGGEAAMSGSAACEYLAGVVATGLDDDQREHLTRFGVRVGARRLSDAATWLSRIGATEAAQVADGQARLVGAIQHSLVRDYSAAMVDALCRLAPTYGRMRQALVAYLDGESADG
ncbi:MAG: hypothetical protein ACRDNF_15885 [Streptosporangiaceae bacterium]